MIMDAVDVLLKMRELELLSLVHFDSLGACSNLGAVINYMPHLTSLVCSPFCYQHSILLLQMLSVIAISKKIIKKGAVCQSVCSVHSLYPFV